MSYDEILARYRLSYKIIIIAPIIFWVSAYIGLSIYFYLFNFASSRVHILDPTAQVFKCFYYMWLGFGALWSVANLILWNSHSWLYRDFCLERFRAIRPSRWATVVGYPVLLFVVGALEPDFRIYWQLSFHGFIYVFAMIFVSAHTAYYFHVAIVALLFPKQPAS